MHEAEYPIFNIMKTYRLFKIKPGKALKWFDWCREIERNRLEAELTLSEENLVQEMCVVFNDYVFYLHDTGNDNPKRSMNLQREINLKHQVIMNECLELVEKGFLGYDVKI